MSVQRFFCIWLYALPVQLECGDLVCQGEDRWLLCQRDKSLSLDTAEAEDFCTGDFIASEGWQEVLG